jgi:hypothetical protein
MRLCVNPCLLLDNNICLQLDKNICLMLDNNICLRWDYVFCWTLPSMNIFYLIGMLGSSTFKFHVLNRMLINGESTVGAFSAFTLIIALPLILYPAYHYFLHLLSTNHKWTQPGCFPLLYKPTAQKPKKIWDSLMSSRRGITPGRLPVELWCHSVAVSLRVFAFVFCKASFGSKYIIL